MTSKDGDDKKPKKLSVREARLAAALRANLRRRKAQERGRDAGEEPGTGAKPKSASSDQ